MNKLFLHEAYKDKTDEKLIALRKSYFQYSRDSIISEGEAQNYYFFLCFPPDKDIMDEKANNKILEKMDNYLTKIGYWREDDHYGDTPRWLVVRGLIEILNDYPELTPRNFDFGRYYQLDYRFDVNINCIVDNIKNLPQRLDFAKFFLKHISLFHPSCFYNEKGKIDNPKFYNDFKDNLQFTIEQIEEKISNQKQTEQKQKPKKSKEEPVATLDELLQYYVEHGNSLYGFLTSQMLTNPTWFNASTQKRINTAEQLRKSVSSNNTQIIVAGDMAQNKYEK